MGVFVLRRALWAVAMLLAILLITFVIFFVIPSDATRTVAGRSGTQADFRATVGLHGTVVRQYVEFVLGLVRHGSLGTSTFTHRSVGVTVLRAVPVTLSLVLGGAVTWMLIAVPVGILSALRPRSLLDRGTMVLVLLGISAHPVWIGLVLAYVLGFRLHLLPITGYCDLVAPSTACGGPVQWFEHLLLPWLTFATWYAALYARMIRASVAETLGADWVRTVQAKGASQWLVLRHVLRNALAPVVAMLAVDVGTMGLAVVGSAVFVEAVYGLPGLGGLLYASLQRHDLPVIAGVVVFTTTAITLLTLVGDVLTSLVDPRVQVRARSF